MNDEMVLTFRGWRKSEFIINNPHSEKELKLLREEHQILNEMEEMIINESKSDKKTTLIFK